MSMFVDERGGLYNEGATPMESHNIHPRPCDLCGGPVDVINFRTLVDYADDKVHCGCQTAGIVQAEQDGLVGFLNDSA